MMYRIAFFGILFCHLILGQDVEYYEVTEIVTVTVKPEEESSGSTTPIADTETTCEYNGNCGETTQGVTSTSESAESSSVSELSDSSTPVSEAASESSSVSVSNSQSQTITSSTESSSEASIRTNVSKEISSTPETHSTPLASGEKSTIKFSTLESQTIFSSTGHSLQSTGNAETLSSARTEESHFTVSDQSKGHSSAAASGSSGVIVGGHLDGKTAAAPQGNSKATATTKAAVNNVFWPGFVNVGSPAAQDPPPPPSPDTLPQEQDFDHANEEVFNIYQVSKCDIDYHDSCSTQWKDCKGYGAQAFCPKSCNFKNCSAAISQHGKSEPYKPKYVPESKCKDNPNFPCRVSVARGDCYATPELMAVNCSMSCGLCDNMKPYAPLSFEEQRLQRWLKSYNNSQFEKYSKVFNRRRIVLHYKIFKKLCGDPVYSRKTFSPFSTEQMTTTNPTQQTEKPTEEASTVSQSSGVVQSSTVGVDAEKSTVSTSMDLNLQTSTIGSAESLHSEKKETVSKSESVLREEDSMSEDTIKEEQDYHQADQETTQNEALASSYIFDGQPVNKCANKIYQTYETSKCQVDYHDSCSTQWADCKGYGATAFCPKFCKVKDCQAALDLHGKLARYQPKYVPESKCSDLPRFNCSKLAERGDCYASPQQFGQLCAKTCGLCTNMKKYTPFSFEDQRLTRWLTDYNSGQYRKYAKVLIRRRKIIKRKIISGKC